jgi:hypothetical protein
MAAPILATDDPRINVTITVPIKGGKTLNLALPRFDYLEEPVLAAMDVELEKIRADEVLNDRQKSRARVLAMLKPILAARVYKQCEDLPLGPLAAISEVWSEQSSMSLGEFLASAESSPTKSSEAPPNTTSTPADTTDATSDAA